MTSLSSALVLAAPVLTPPQVGYGTLFALVIFIVASMYIGVLANKAMSSGAFMKGFFLGNRGLGAWALALTATVQSGGTFMGFPSLVYTHGWIVALWICGYMVVPITGFGILGKRMAQLSRKTGALTVPDLFRARFNSPALGLTASLFIMFYMSFMMVAQFKSGALVMKIAWPASGSLALSEDATQYKLTTDKLAGLELPAEVRDKVAAFADQDFANEVEFKAALKEKLADGEFTAHQSKIVAAASPIDWLFYLGLGIFTLTVVGYTMLGGFLAAVWTDLFQSVMMLVGVVFLLILAVTAVGGMETATVEAVSKTGPGFVFGPGFDPTNDGREYLPLGLAVSFFWVWVYAGVGSPAGMVRIMAGKSTEVIRKSIFLLSGYNYLIYLPLVVICICGRALIPDLPPGKTDEIIPRLAMLTTAKLPMGSFLAGLILAAPFGAVMATVSSYLVVIASGLVRDVYQRFINPQAGSHDLRRLSYMAMIGVGAIAVLANIKPVAYLQAIVVFSGTGAAATFCMPALMIAFWRRTTVAGTLSSMFGGAGTMLVLYVLGFSGYGADRRIGSVTTFRPYFLLDLDPMLWGLLVSFLAGVIVSLLTTPPDAALVSKLFDAEESGSTPATKPA
ncbi:MAG: sodium:solute symporter [Planctomycetes bacterium]|nr:sodium:solute symporter [Planctomycetota bacterium]